MTERMKLKNPNREFPGSGRKNGLFLRAVGAEGAEIKIGNVHDLGVALQIFIDKNQHILRNRVRDHSPAQAQEAVISSGHNLGAQISCPNAFSKRSLLSCVIVGSSAAVHPPASCPSAEETEIMEKASRAVSSSTIILVIWVIESTSFHVRYSHIEWFHYIRRITG